MNTLGVIQKTLLGGPPKFFHLSGGEVLPDFANLQKECTQILSNTNYKKKNSSNKNMGTCTKILPIHRGCRGAQILLILRRGPPRFLCQKKKASTTPVIFCEWSLNFRKIAIAPNILSKIRGQSLFISRGKW